MATATKAIKKTTEKKAGPVPVPAVKQKESAISKRAMLVTVTVHRWKPQVTDEVVSKKVAEDHGAKSTAGKYRKRLFPKDTFFDTASIENEIRREFWDRTLPWSDDSGRILLNVGYLPFTQKINELTDKFNAEWRKVLASPEAYKALIERAEKEFGTLFDPALYPSYEDACAKFGVTVRVKPIPTGQDLRVDVGDQELERLQRELNEDAQKTIQEAMKTVWGRLSEVVEHMVKRLNAYSIDPETGKTQNTFRDSLVTNITELLDLLPSLNVTQDSKLFEFEQAIRKTLVVHPASVLRDDEKIRKSVAVQAQEILDKMGAYL